MYQKENKSKNILITPLNWGLGHATRCIPIINELIKFGFNPIIASDGAALELLKKEFPDLQSLKLPSYKIKYPENGKFFKLKTLQNLPSILFSIHKERKIVENYITEYNISGIISDNRFGVYSNKIPSVYITHQLTVLSGNSTWLSTFLHQKIIKKFNQCWVPDYENNFNLSGILGHPKKKIFNIKYIGVLSRLEKEILPKKYDLMILLSGPEPQRTILENKLKSEILNFSGNIIFIQGLVENEQKIEQKSNVLYYNYMTTNDLQKTFNESVFVLCRSGYTTIMDLIKLNKNAFLIPTPGQFEQEYLAKKLNQNCFFSTTNQRDFNLKMLSNKNHFNNFEHHKIECDFKEIFSVFQ